MNRQDGRLSELIRRCRDQDEAAWTEFHACFRRVAGQVLSRFSNLGPIEREEAQDEARVAVALEIDAGRVRATTDGGVVSFLKAVITNAARDAWRRKRPGEPLPPLLRDNGPSPAERARQKAELDCAEQVLKTWSADNRFIFVMKLERVSAAAIKADLQHLFSLFVTIEAVDVRFFRLRAELRRRCGRGPDHE